MTPPASQLPPAIQQGAECAWCRQPFVQAHGRPVYCQKCYDRAFATRKSFQLLPLAEYALREPDA